MAQAIATAGGLTSAEHPHAVDGGVELTFDRDAYDEAVAEFAARQHTELQTHAETEARFRAEHSDDEPTHIGAVVDDRFDHGGES